MLKKSHSPITMWSISNNMLVWEGTWPVIKLENWSCTGWGVRLFIFAIFFSFYTEPCSGEQNYPAPALLLLLPPLWFCSLPSSWFTSLKLSPILIKRISLALYELVINIYSSCDIYNMINDLHSTKPLESRVYGLIYVLGVIVNLKSS